VLKGYDYRVAAPQGRDSITENAPPGFATAGGRRAGGFVAGLLEQGRPGL